MGSTGPSDGIDVEVRDVTDGAAEGDAPPQIESTWSHLCADGYRRRDFRTFGAGCSSGEGSTSRGGAPMLGALMRTDTSDLGSVRGYRRSRRLTKDDDISRSTPTPARTNPKKYIHATVWHAFDAWGSAPPLEALHAAVRVCSVAMNQMPTPMKARPAIQTEAFLMNRGYRSSRYDHNEPATTTHRQVTCAALPRTLEERVRRDATSRPSRTV